MRKNTSPARPGADKRSNFHALTVWDFHAGSESRRKSLDIINLQRVVYCPLKYGRD